MFIVLGSNSSQQVQAFGPFAGEATAARWVRRQERERPWLDWLALPITPRQEGEYPLGRVS